MKARLLTEVKELQGELADCEARWGVEKRTLEASVRDSLTKIAKLEQRNDVFEVQYRELEEQMIRKEEEVAKLKHLLHGNSQAPREEAGALATLNSDGNDATNRVTGIHKRKTIDRDQV